MQRASSQLYTYDKEGKLVSYVPSGGTSDVVAQHAVLDPRLKGPRHVTDTGLAPTILNSPHLFTAPVSLSSPPQTRPKTLSSEIGYATTDDVSTLDLFGLTNAHPSITLTEPVLMNANNSNTVYYTTLKHRTRI